MSNQRKTVSFSTFSVDFESCFSVISFWFLSGLFMICAITNNWETNHSVIQFVWRTTEFLFQSVQSICTDCKGMNSFNSVVRVAFSISFCRIYEYWIIRSCIKRRDYLKDSRELCCFSLQSVIYSHWVFHWISLQLSILCVQTEFMISIIDTIQRLGKYKWYAYGLQAATEKGGPSVNPQFFLIKAITYRMITSRILKELEPLIYCVCLFILLTQFSMCIQQSTMDCYGFGFC